MIKLEITAPNRYITINWQKSEDVEDLCHMDFAKMAASLVPGEAIIIKCVDVKE